MLYLDKRLWTVDLSEVPERLDQVIERAEMNRTAFAKLIGQQPSVISEILNGKRKISVRVMTALVERGISLDWLLTGKGCMTLPKPADARHQVAEETRAYAQLQGQAILTRLRAIVREIETDLSEDKPHDPD